MSRTKFPSPKKIFEFSKRGEVDKLFRNYFNIGMSSFYDGSMSMISKRICIDMFKFDDWLHEQVGDYESEHLSMNTTLVKHYGMEAKKFN